MRFEQTQLTKSALLILLAFTPETTAQVSFPSGPPTLPADCPSDDIWQSGPTVTKFGAGITSTVRVRPILGRVDLDWRYSDPELPTIAVPNNTQATASEIFATAYWPTYVQVIDKSHWCVAGKGRGDTLVLEYWTFASTGAGGAPVPSILGHVSPGNPPEWSWILPQRSRASEILRTDSTHTGLIRALFRDAGSAQHVYIWYDGTRTFCRVDLASGVVTPQAAPSTLAGAITVTSLSNGYDTFYCCDYQNKGYCYFFVDHEPSTSGQLNQPVVLVDSNRDGIVESSVLISASDWVANGWSNYAQVVAQY